MPPISSSQAWKALEEHQKATAGTTMRELFAADPQRFSRFSARLGDLLLDYSKNRITGETMRLLVALAEEADLAGWREKMFAGEKINATEGRAVLHVALGAATAALPSPTWSTSASAAPTSAR